MGLDENVLMDLVILGDGKVVELAMRMLNGGWMKEEEGGAAERNLSRLLTGAWG